jgi:N-terminal domain of toast_rack, DUF2154
MKARYLLLAPALLSLTGCVIEGSHGGTVQYSSESVEVDDSEVVRVELRMGAGDLRITDGALKLLRADFAYSVPSWKPEVRYSRQGKEAALTIEQPGHNHTTTLGNTKYSWDLQLNKKVPVELTLNFGAGQARLDLGSLDLRGLEVHMGVGQLDVDLRGAPRHSYNVTINGGIGQATVHVAADAGIYAEAHGGIGSIQVRGLRQEEGHWVSPSYDRAGNKIRIEIQGGIGEVKVIAD